MNTTQVKCQAKNPANCRYHGSLEAHEKVLSDKSARYVEVLKTQLSGVTDPKSRYAVEDAKEAMERARESVDAHDENFEVIKTRLDALVKISEKPGYHLDDPYHAIQNDIRELRKRYRNAGIVREKASRSETDAELGWETSYVIHVKKGSVLASGEKVLDVREPLGLSAQKREVVLEDENRNVSTRIWDAYTRVTTLPPSAQ